MKIEMIGSKDNPIVVDSLRNEINFLNNLVTVNGDYVLYQRLGSTHENGRILDRYELLDCSGNKHELYIDAYGDKIVVVPPAGFLFDSDCFGSTYEDFFDGDDDDIDEEYIYKRPEDKERRPIDRYIFESYGSNCRVADFPKDIIDMMIKENIIYITMNDENMDHEELIEKIIGYFKIKL